MPFLILRFQSQHVTYLAFGHRECSIAKVSEHSYKLFKNLRIEPKTVSAPACKLLILKGLSPAWLSGRALASHARGQKFESSSGHQYFQ